MKHFLFSSLLLSLLFLSCKKSETSIPDPYSWLNEYEGNFMFYFTDTLYQSADPFEAYSQSHTSYSIHNRDGTIFRIVENKIKIHDYNITLIQDYPISIDQNKKFSLSLDTTYYRPNQGGNIHEQIKISGSFINKDSITYSYYDYLSNSNAMSSSSYGIVNGSRIK